MGTVTLIVSAGIVVAVIAGGIIIYRKFAGSVNEKTTSSKNETVTVVKTENNDAKAEFIKNAGAFIGIYEPLYKMSMGKLKNKHSVFADWDVRVKNLSGAQSFQKLWMGIFGNFESWNEEMYAAKSKQLIELLRSFGIKWVMESDFIVSENTYKKYSTLDGEIIEIGTPVRVVSPYWQINEDILEKGIIDVAIQSGGGDCE